MSKQRMRKQREEYDDYMKQVGERMRSSPSRGQLEKMKQEAPSDDIGIAAVLGNSRNREVMHLEKSRNSSPEKAIK